MKPRNFTGELMSEESKSIIKGYSTEKSKKIHSKVGLWNEEKKLFRKFFKKGSKILDIGCGGGRTTIPLSKLGYKVTAIDIVPKFIKIAKYNAKKNKVNPKVEMVNVTKMKYKAKSFDNALFSYNGIEHLSPEEIEKGMSNIFKVLKRNGIFIFTVHSILNRKYWLFWMKEFPKFHLKKIFGIKQKETHFGDKYWMDYGEGVYSHFATPCYYLKKLTKVGFKKVQIIPQKKVMKEQKFSVLDNFTDGNIFIICKKD